MRNLFGRQALDHECVGKRPSRLGNPDTSDPAVADGIEVVDLLDQEGLGPDTYPAGPRNENGGRCLLRLDRAEDLERSGATDEWDGHLAGSREIPLGQVLPFEGMSRPEFVAIPTRRKPRDQLGGHPAMDGPVVEPSPERLLATEKAGRVAGRKVGDGVGQHVRSPCRLRAADHARSVAQLWTTPASRTDSPQPGGMGGLGEAIPSAEPRNSGRQRPLGEAKPSRREANPSEQGARPWVALGLAAAGPTDGGPGRAGGQASSVRAWSFWACSWRMRASKSSSSLPSRTPERSLVLKPMRWSATRESGKL